MKFHDLKKTDFDFWKRMDTRWSDMDSLGHINHTSYLSYMESARVDVYVDLGFKGIRKDMDESTILGSMEVHYLSQCVHPVSLDVGHRISRVGGKSFDFLAGIFLKNDKTLICAALFKLIAFNYEKNQSIFVPKKIKSNCRPFES